MACDKIWYEAAVIGKRRVLVESGKLRCKSALGRFEWVRPAAAVQIVLAIAKAFIHLPPSTFNHLISLILSIFI